MKKKSTHRAKKEISPIKIILTNGVKVFESTGKDIEDAAQKLKPEFTKGHSILRLEKDGKSSELRLRPIQVKRFGFHKITQQILSKRLESKLI